MLRFLCPTLTAGLLMAGCSAPIKPIVIDRQQLVLSGQLSLTAIEVAVAEYNSKRPIAAKVLAELQAADAGARQALASLNASVAANLPADAQLAANALQSLSMALPPGVIPPAGEAGLLAFTALVQVIAQTAPQPVNQPSVVTDPVSVPISVPVVSTQSPATVPSVVSPPVADNRVSAPHAPLATMPHAIN